MFVGFFVGLFVACFVGVRLGVDGRLLQPCVGPGHAGKGALRLPRLPSCGARGVPWSRRPTVVARIKVGGAAEVVDSMHNLHIVAKLMRARRVDPRERGHAGANTGISHCALAPWARRASRVIKRGLSQFGDGDVRRIVAAQSVPERPHPTCQRCVGPWFGTDVDQCSVGRHRPIDMEDPRANVAPQNVGDLEGQEVRCAEQVTGYLLHDPRAGRALVDEQGDYGRGVNETGPRSVRAGWSSAFGVERVENVRDRDLGGSRDRSNAVDQLVDSRVVGGVGEFGPRYSWSDRPEPTARAASVFLTCIGTFRMGIATVMQPMQLHDQQYAAGPR